MLLSIDGFSKWANALMMIFAAAGTSTPLFQLGVAIAHFSWAYLQFSQAINFHHVLTEHAQPNIGCLQIGFAVSILYYALDGLNVWSKDYAAYGAWACGIGGFALCVIGIATVKMSTRGIAGGETKKPLLY